MAEQEQPTTNEATQEQKPATPPAGAQNTDTPSQEQTVPYARFKEVNDELKTLKEERATAAKAQEADNEKKLAEQQAWQQLADKRKTQVDELTPKAELADRLTEMVTQQYAATIKDWPEQVKAMAPDDTADILTKLDWMNKATPLAKELMDDKTPTPGNGRRPSPMSPAGQAKATEQQRQQWSRQASQRYR